MYLYKVRVVRRRILYEYKDVYVESDVELSRNDAKEKAWEEGETDHARSGWTGAPGGEELEVDDVATYTYESSNFAED